MLIRINEKQSFFGGRNSSRMKMEDESRYHMRAGMARVAMLSKLTGRPEVDAVNRPLKYSNEMSQRHSINTLEAWSKGRSVKTVIGEPTGSKRVPWEWEKDGIS